jgi:hypothetical protein
MKSPHGPWRVDPSNFHSEKRIIDGLEVDVWWYDDSPIVY